MFLIEPHFRLHEWVAREKGYFDDEGLDYEFKDQNTKKDAQAHNIGPANAGAGPSSKWALGGTQCRRPPR